MFVHHSVIIKLVWIIPFLSMTGLSPCYRYTHPIRAKGPPFEPWVVPTEPVGVYRLVVDEPNVPLYTADKDFISNE